MASALPNAIGRYRILCELGQGGMAVLYLGRAVGPGGFQRLFAIKTIHEQYSREEAFVQMFLDEARLAARIHHPNAVPVYEVGADQGRHYIAMEYVDGETLSSTISKVWKAEPPFPVGIALHIVEGVCEALHATHELTDSTGASLNVVHRDVSPQNIMVGYDGIPRLMDFGVAKAADQLAHTRPGVNKGKVAYMAPEQLSGGTLDRRVDVFALAVVLWEALAGRRLFKGENDFVTADRIRAGVIPKLDNFRDDVPPEIGPMLRHALAKDPSRRPASARDFGRAIREIAMEHRLLVSTPEVAEVMRRVFAKRYAKRQELVRQASELGLVESTELLGDDEGARAFNHIPTVTGELSVERSRTEAGAAEGSASAFVPEAATTIRRRTVFVTFAAVALLAGLMTFAVQAWLSEPAEPPVQIAPRPTPVPPKVPEPIRIEFDVTPPAAKLSVDDQPISKTLVREPSDRELVVHVSADGFEPQTRVVRPNRTQRVTVELTPIPEVRPEPPPPPPKRRRRPDRGNQRLLLEGDEL